GGAFHFQEDQYPACVELGDGIVISLSGGLGNLESIIEGTPRASVGCIRGIDGMKRAAHNREILAYGFLWNSPQNVQTEFQAEGMDKIGERLEVCALRSIR